MRIASTMERSAPNCKNPSKRKVYLYTYIHIYVIYVHKSFLTLYSEMTLKQLNIYIKNTDSLQIVQ